MDDWAFLYVLADDSNKLYFIKTHQSTHTHTHAHGEKELSVWMCVKTGCIQGINIITNARILSTSIWYTEHKICYVHISTHTLPVAIHTGHDMGFIRKRDGASKRKLVWKPSDRIGFNYYGCGLTGLPYERSQKRKGFSPNFQIHMCFMVIDMHVFVNHPHMSPIYTMSLTMYCRLAARRSLLGNFKWVDIYIYHVEWVTQLHIYIQLMIKWNRNVIRRKSCKHVCVCRERKRKSERKIQEVMGPIG